MFAGGRTSRPGRCACFRSGNEVLQQAAGGSGGRTRQGDQEQAVARPDAADPERSPARRAAPNYADYIVFGAFQWARGQPRSSCTRRYDPVATWREEAAGRFRHGAKIAGLSSVAARLSPQAFTRSHTRSRVQRVHPQPELRLSGSCGNRSTGCSRFSRHCGRRMWRGERRFQRNDDDRAVTYTAGKPRARLRIAKTVIEVGVEDETAHESARGM